jgi:formate dehydrogenase iron-sulfur subunit
MEVGAVTAAGLIGVFCSMMIYHDTRRALWHWRRSAPLFFGTAAVFGAAAAFALNCHNNIALAAFVTTLALKLLIEILVVRHVADRELTSLKKTALLVTGKFQYAAFARVVCAVGAVGIALLLNTGALSPTLALLPFLLASVGELIERLLFFRTVDAPKMPGGLVA